MSGSTGVREGEKPTASEKKKKSLSSGGFRVFRNVSSVAHSFDYRRINGQLKQYRYRSHGSVLYG